MLLSTFYEEITQYKKIAKFNTLFQNKYQLFIGKLKQKHQVINMIHCAIITHGRAYERKDEIAQNVSRMVYVQGRLSIVIIKAASVERSQRFETHYMGS